VLLWSEQSAESTLEANDRNVEVGFGFGKFSGLIGLPHLSVN